jgi:3-oxoacyl-[acyl-carrier protein] reductase
MKELDFTGKVVLVVGGSSGIGNGIAQAFCAQGADTHVWGTRPTASDYADEEGSNLQDLTYSSVNVADVNALTSQVSNFERLDVLVLCQGIVRYNRQEFERTGWDEVIEVNLNSVMFTATKFKEMLSASGGAMIIVSSVAGFTAARGNPAYAASKAGAVSLTKTLGQAWASEGIRVNGIAPGFVDTKLTKVTTENEKRLKATIAAIPQRRLGTPADMAGASLFLASPLASYVCGQTLIVDGGISL